MTTVCHAASVTLEQFHKLRYLKDEKNTPKYLKYQRTSMVKKWLRHTFYITIDPIAL